jgi:hypothetical protein
MSFLLNNKTLLIHISCEIIVITSIIIWYNRNSKLLHNKISELNTKVEQYESRIKYLETNMNDMIKVVDNILRENTEKPNIRERAVERTRQDDEEHDEQNREQHREQRREQHMEKPRKQQKEEFKTVSNNIDSKKIRSRIKPKLEKVDLSDTESVLDRFLEKEIKELEEENKENSINNLD